MGMSASGILAYGYNLGSGETEWEVQEVDEYGDLALHWFNPNLDDDFTEAAKKRLLVASGFTETDWRADGYFDRKDEAEARVGVGFESYCSADFSEWILAAKVITVYQGHTKLLDVPRLAGDPETHGWDAKLSAAL